MASLHVSPKYGRFVSPKIVFCPNKFEKGACFFTDIINLIS